MSNLCNRCWMSSAIEDYPPEFGGDFHPLCFTCICIIKERDEEDAQEGTMRKPPRPEDFPPLQDHPESD